MPLQGPALERSVNLLDLLHVGLNSKPDDLALVSTGTSWTYLELERDSNRLASNLLDLGLRKGDRVASLLPNRNVLIVYYIACLKAGLVVVPLNYRYMAPEIDHALELTKASILLAHAERDADLTLVDHIDKLPLGVIGFEAEDDRSLTLETLLEQQTEISDIPSPEPGDPCFVFFTSGSTGKPKGVTHTHETMGWMIASAIEAYEIMSDDTILPGSSISHIGGLGMSLFGLAAGAKIITAHTYDTDEIIPLFNEHQPTLLWMLPAALITLVHDQRVSRDLFGSLRLCTSGGDKVPAELEHSFTEMTGLMIDECWGMSEIGFSTVSPPSGINKPGSVGNLNPGFTLSIRDEDGTELQTNEKGRLWIKSRSNMIGYWDNPEATTETIQKGWLDTGDVMRVDEDGYLWFCGRKKQIIIHDGSNICPQEVEEALLEHDAVVSAGVVGIYDLVHGENVRAYITLLEGVERPSLQELIQFARERIGYKAPEEIQVLDDMPINATGKVDRVSLKKMAEVRIVSE